MSMIKISCPSCKSALKIAEEKLTETQGRVVCHECQHIFRLVKKSKKNPPPAKTSPANTSPTLDDVEREERDFRLPDDDFSDPLDSKPQKSAQPAPKTELPPLHYRVPKAEAKTPFAEVGQENPIAFNLLDYKTANQQVPQVNINPPATINGEQIDSKNNITIHTGNLVFTLMGDGQANATGSLPAESNQFNEVPMTNQQAMAMLNAATSSRSELNWTVATFAALMILMVQLFYLVLMMY